MTLNLLNVMKSALLALVISFVLPAFTTPAYGSQSSSVITDAAPFYSGDLAVLNEIIQANGLTQYANQPLTFGIQVWEEGRLTFLLIDKPYELHTLPVSVGNLTELRGLFLSNQNLHQLPESIGQLSKLQKLHLDNNRLTLLPASIGNLSQLGSLYLQHNRLVNLPMSVSKLNMLKTLNLTGNPLDETAYDVLLIEEITSFYQ
ncbi:MAG TPA: hypothetical protein PK239_04135 [Chitinophagales bacterium]|nr:hypothetical protein [Chitinophagales bacterium]HRK26460.1 hypothetical protein [Chitinophagales bacterium]